MGYGFDCGRGRGLQFLGHSSWVVQVDLDGGDDDGWMWCLWYGWMWMWWVDVEVFFFFFVG